MTTNFVEIIRECENASGGGSKNVIKAALAKADTTAKRLIKETLDPYRVFCVRKFELPKTNAEVTTSVAIENFLKVLDLLNDRVITGNAARDAVTNALSAFSADDLPYYVRVLNKDVKAGFSADTANKVWNEKVIDDFSVMLAEVCKTPDDFEANVHFPAWADVKYDGERTIATYSLEHGIQYYSRSGKLAGHCDGLFDEDLERVYKETGEEFIIDCERYASNFTETQNAKSSDNKDAKQALRLHAFFYMSLADWKAKTCKDTMRENRAKLEKILANAGCEKILLARGKQVDNYEEMMEWCNESIDTMKFEGLIVKDYESHYQWDRSYAWVKVKRFYDVDARVIGYYHGRKGTRLENVIGGLTVRFQLEDGTIGECNVGSGFSDELRKDILENWETKWRNSTVVIKYQEVSKTKSKELVSLRFPVFAYGPRDDKLVEV